jgi:hypothetical protein
MPTCNMLVTENQKHHVNNVVEFQLFSRRHIGPTLQNHTLQIRNEIKKRETMKHIL